MRRNYSRQGTNHTQPHNRGERMEITNGLNQTKSYNFAQNEQKIDFLNCCFAYN